MYADNFLNGNQNVPLSTLGNAAQGYSHPDYTGTQSYTLNVRGGLQLNAEKSLAGNLYYRHIVRDVLNSNIGSVVATSTNNATCVATADCPASNLLAQYTQNIYGGNLQWSNSAKLFDRPQVMTAGLNAEYGKTSFHNLGQNAFLDSLNGTVAADAYVQQAGIESTNRRFGLFATDTLNANERLAVTLSGRYIPSGHLNNTYIGADSPNYVVTTAKILENGLQKSTVTLKDPGGEEAIVTPRDPEKPNQPAADIIASIQIIEGN